MGGKITIKVTAYQNAPAKTSGLLIRSDWKNETDRDTGNFRSGPTAIRVTRTTLANTVRSEAENRMTSTTDHLDGK